MYSRKLDDTILSFEHAKFLHQGSFVMYDTKTISLWIHTTGKSVIGDHKGKILDFLPSTVTTWGNWKTQHPKTTVLNVKRGRNPRFNLKKRLDLGGLSVGQPGQELKLYPLSLLNKDRLIQDVLGEEPIVVYFDAEAFDFHAFKAGKLTFALGKRGIVTDKSGRVWNLATGTSGKDKLQSIPVTPWLTRAWKRFYPDGEIYSQK